MVAYAYISGALRSSNIAANFGLKYRVFKFQFQRRLWEEQSFYVLFQKLLLEHHLLYANHVLIDIIVYNNKIHGLIGD